jgi:hypothetical protein
MEWSSTRWSAVLDLFPVGDLNRRISCNKTRLLPNALSSGMETIRLKACGDTPPAPIIFRKNLAEDFEYGR